MTTEGTGDDAPGERDEVVCVLAHTHWDREWYLPAGRLRQRLVALIDELLDDADPANPFLLDGQAVVLDDYTDVRPERREQLARALRSGALEAGPWYVLADELIPSGEALVRNLLVGLATLRRFGAEPPPVLYSPDAFGHAAALPAIARGFGFELVIVWRGYGGPRWPAGDTARWQAPDGGAVTLFHLPQDGYEFGSNLPADVTAAERWRAMRAVLAPRSRTGLLLVPNGADHHARQAAQSDAIAALAAAAAPRPVRRLTLRAFAAELLARSARRSLPMVRGELRDSYGYTWTLQGTCGTRARQKRRNAAVERLLTRDTEPWTALAARHAGVSRAHLTAAAWRAVLLSHPHDTLCGTSTDEVARAMDARLDDATSQAAGIRDDALLDLVGHDAVAARTRQRDWRSLMLVRNRAARMRGGIAELEIETFLADVGVGPGSTPPERVRHVVAPRLLHGDVPVQLLATRRTNRRTESPRHYPDNDLVEVRRVVAWLPPIPGYSVAPLALDEEGTGGAPLADTSVSAASELLDNGTLRVQLDVDGTISVSASDGSWTIAKAIAIEDVGDRGDLYTHSPFGAVRIEHRFLRARLVHTGPLRAEIETRWRIVVTSAADRRLAGARKDTGGAGFVDLRIRLRLDAGSPYLRLVIDGVNGATSHRLRLRLRTGIANADVWADAAFGPVRREPIEVSEDERRVEAPPPTAPLHRYVSLFDATRGATVYSDGLAEYEADAAGDVAVTLVRSVGDLSRNDLPERPGHAGWPVPTPEAQMLGPFGAELALFMHGPRTSATVDLIERTGDDVLLPLVGTTLRSAIADYPLAAGLELHGRGLAFSAAKESENGEWLVLRCVNLTEDTVGGSWELPFEPREANLARLDETALGAAPVSGRSVSFVASPRAIVTLLVR